MITQSLFTKSLMKIITWNVNGIRSCYAKGLLHFIQTEQPDILCLQEIKAAESDFPAELLHIDGYKLYVNSAQKKGYAGTAIFTRKLPTSVHTDFSDHQFCSEGRIQTIVFPQFTLINLYLPQGGRTKANLPYKLTSYQNLFKHLKAHADEKIILCGDFNIAHTEIDLARPKSNKNNIMFSPEERQQIGALLEMGYIDTLRRFHPEADIYTWWIYGFDARARNVGWRIDYIFASRSLQSQLSNAYALANIKGSDHCPMVLELTNM